MKRSRSNHPFSMGGVASLLIVLVAALLGAGVAAQFGTGRAPPRDGVLGSKASSAITGTAAPASPGITDTAAPASPAITGTALPANVEAVVVDFYRLVERGDLAAAYSLFSDRLRSEISRSALEERFVGPREFTVTAQLVELEGDRATVAVEVVETMSPGSQRLRGDWELVVVNGRWLLDRVRL